jgi:hypothetical protein
MKRKKSRMVNKSKSEKLPEPPKPKPKKFESTRPPVFVPDKSDPTGYAQVQVGPKEPTDLSEYKGKYRQKDMPPDAPLFGLKIVDDDPYGNTHHLKNSEYHWSGTKEDFKANFDKA